MRKEYRTAIRRYKLSRPARKLLEMDAFHKMDHILDYGCGKEDDVTDLYLRGYDIVGYDPHWRDDKSTLEKKYSLILCTYVLCVVDKETREDIMEQIESLLVKSGYAYISVRRDIKKDQVSKTGSKQYAVKLDLPIFYENSEFCIYEYVNR
ncbi:MAG: methyltransferase domain-containing protein [Promethearchaeota archaeon]